MPRGLLTFIGVSEMLGGLGVVLPALTGILPWLTPLAAAGPALIMLLAAGFHLRRKEVPQALLNAVLLALAASVAVGRFVIPPF